MSLLTRLFARIRNRRFDDDLAEELRFHEEMKRQALESDGGAAADARHAARRALGNVTLMREQSRGVWIAPWIESVLQDVRYAFRALRRQPLHTATAGTVLVVAIGLNTSLFTFFKGGALQPWPADDPGSLVQIRSIGSQEWVGPTMNEYAFIRRHAAAFSGVAAHVSTPAVLHVDGLTDIGVQSTTVSTEFFSVVGAPIPLGRGFLPADERPSNEEPPAVLSDHLWRRHFGSDPRVIGKTVSINRKAFTVVGILDPRFDGLGRPVDLWLSLTHAATELPTGDVCCINMIGRLRRGAGVEQARAQLQVLHDQFAVASRRKAGQVQVFGTAYASNPDAADLDVIGAVWMALVLVLLLACANVGNLQLARGLARRTELATRLAIGASRGRVVRQLIVEALVLSLAAGALSIAVSAVLPQAVLSLFGQDIPPTRVHHYRPDWMVVLFTGAICMLACVSFALAPALRSTRGAIPLGSMDRSSTPHGRVGLRSALLAMQIAACCVLLAAASLVTRGIARAMSFDPGFRVKDVLRVSASLPAETPDDQQRAFLTRLLSALEQDAAERIGVSVHAPLVSDDHARFYTSRIALPGQSGGSFTTIQRRSVSSGFFAVLDIPLVKGRLFASDAAGELVVNEAFVRAYFPHDDPLGNTVGDVDRRGRVTATNTIVGVVRDAYLAGLERIVPVVFRPTTQGIFLTWGGPAAVEKIRATALELNSAARVRAWPLSEDLRDDLESSRQGAALAWGIGLLGLTLATVGVFGVFAYAVEERRREIGVRLALGARSGQIVRMLLSTSGRAMLGGLALGVMASLACGPLLRAYLLGLSPLDPAAYGLAAGLIAFAALLATILPARRATRIDPALTLRED
jgi:predicted permease